MAGQEIERSIGPLCQVAVRFPSGDGILTYLYDEKLLDGHLLKRGDLVEVPLGRRKALGCVLKTSLEDPECFTDQKLGNYKLKDVLSVLDPDFSLSSFELELYSWMANYYHYNLGMIIFDCLPKILKRPRPIEILKGKGDTFPYSMNDLQKNAYEGIKNSFHKGFERFFLHGVTGSGKTLVYLNLILDTLKMNKSVLFLIPEINLTPQFLETFTNYLDCPILQYHSSITASSKNVSWKYLKSSKDAVLIMGVRSSIFLPVNNLGLVIVDEEHDQSFKQTDRCPYNGRDLAIVKAKLSNCPIVLGSATPSVENYYQYKKMPERYFELKKRVSGNFPKVKLIDARKKEGQQREEFDEKRWPFMEESLEEIQNSLDKNDQVLVFVNRLGFANFIQCRSCGHKFTDPNTDTALRYFKSKNILSSSHSDYQIPMPDICPNCSNMSLLQKGFGTEKVCEILKNYFPSHNVDRFDRDEIKNMDQLEEKLNLFHSGKIDILVGTQMLSKGHNFKKVNLVLVLGVDSLLNFPDFRSIEKTYATITQITGRAGRYSDDAKVLIQTMTPENNIFEYIKEHSFNGFYEDELKIREFASFPPFSKMVVIHFSSRFKDRLITNITSVATSLKEISEKHFSDLQIHGPIPAFIEKRVNNYTWYFTIKSSDITAIHKLLNYFESSYKSVSGISYKIDVDPYTTL